MTPEWGIVLRQAGQIRAGHYRLLAETREDTPNPHRISLGRVIIKEEHRVMETEQAHGVMWLKESVAWSLLG